jgi:hypothetical protein
VDPTGRVGFSPSAEAGPEEKRGQREKGSGADFRKRKGVRSREEKRGQEPISGLMPLI